MPLSCRFYKEKFPEVDDVVMVNVRSIGEMGAYVHLLEYNNIEGEPADVCWVCFFILIIEIVSFSQV